MEGSISRVVQGCMGWGKWGKQFTTQEMAELIQHCVEVGITTFDHADIYGDYTTETQFGAAFKASGIAREQIEIITKCGIQYVGETRNNEIKHYQYDAKYIVWSAEKSIQDLQCEYLDLFLLHRPSPLMDRDEIAKAASHLYEKGLIKNFGVSNFTVRQMDLIDSRYLIDANQIEFSITQFDALTDGRLDYMQTHGILPLCWSPLGSVYREKNEQTYRIHEALDTLTEHYNATKDQLLYAWIMKHPAMIHPVIGTTNKERISLAAEAVKIQLSEVDWFKIWVASKGNKVP